MAYYTHLQMINRVLARLRESEVDSLAPGAYSTLIGELVKDAAREVESKHTWSGLRDQLTFFTTGSQVLYDVAVGTDLVLFGVPTTPQSRIAIDHKSLPMAYNLTTNSRLRYLPIEQAMEELILKGGTQTGQPDSFFLVPNLNGKGYKIQILPAPTTQNALSFFFDNSVTDRLEQGGINELSVYIGIPGHVVVNLAYFYALQERGEEMGEPGQSAYNRYTESLAEAKSADIHNTPFKYQLVVP